MRFADCGELNHGILPVDLKKMTDLIDLIILTNPTNLRSVTEMTDCRIFLMILSCWGLFKYKPP